MSPIKFTDLKHLKISNTLIKNIENLAFFDAPTL